METRVGDAPVVRDPPENRPQLELALERKDAELRASHARLRELERARQSLVQMIVHDLKSPLAALASNAKVLRRALTLDDDLDGALDDVVELAAIMERMVLDVLDVTRAGEARLAPRLELVALGPFLTALVDRAQGPARAAGKTLALAVATDAPLEVQADPEHLRRVLENLLDNAFKYAPAGSEVALEAGAAGLGLYALRVRDRGPGIPPPERDAIFEPHARLGRDRAGRAAPTARGGRSGGDAMSGGSWLLGRQPILDRAGHVTAYELLFRSSRENRAVIEDAPRATAAVILGALSGFGVREVLGGHSGFINVDERTLHSDSLELLPREAVVLELLETVPLGPETLERCRALKAAGFSLALDDHRYDPAHAALYDTVDVVKVDLSLTAPEALPREVQGLRQGRAKLLAEKVETRAQFERCLELGFDLFQGWHFARPSVLERRKLDEDATRLLELLRLLQEDADIAAVERVVRSSPGLAYKLLVLVNSVALRARERIGTVRQAIAMLGRDQMRRWVQLALFASGSAAGLDDPIVDLAAARAGLMEGLARRHPGLAGRDAAEQAFMTGMLSLLDAIYAVRMPDLVSSLHLSERVADALLRRDGPLGALLRAAERMESLELEDAACELEELGIPADQVLEAQRRALAWKNGER